MSEYSKVTPEIVEKIKAVVAPNRVYTGADINEDFSHDEMSIYGKAMPELVVDAVSTEEIAATMKIAYDNNIPVTARGAGTGLVGACVPIAGGIVINTTKMNKILEYDLNNFVVKVQCGVLLNDLAEDCVSKGLMYPPDPGEKFATLGGNVSTNAGGMRACKYGATRDYVRAMEVVLPTGEVTRFGSTVSKTSSGYSLLNLMIGSEGTLGIITELTLKVIPAPKEVISLVIPFETLADCIGTVPQFKKNGLDPQALEFMEKAIVQASERYIGKSVYPQKIDGVEAGAFCLLHLMARQRMNLIILLKKLLKSLLKLAQSMFLLLIHQQRSKMHGLQEAHSWKLSKLRQTGKMVSKCSTNVTLLFLWTRLLHTLNMYMA